MKALRVWLWITAMGLVAATFLHPRWVLPQNVHRYLVVVDITQSMNARDYHLPNLPPDRLSFAKAALEYAVLNLPCGSQIGLGVFTHKDTELLLEPLEVCRHAQALGAALHNIDWRSAWAADSFIAYGLFDALRIAKDLKADLVFLTDGDQVPVTARDPAFFGRPGIIGGWIVGVGTPRPVPIPKLDLDGRMTGYWQTTDLPRSAQSVQTQVRPKEAGLLLSRLDEAHLHRLANVTGLGYLNLTTPQQLAEVLRGPHLAKALPVAVDLRPWLGLGALLAVILTILV